MRPTETYRHRITRQAIARIVSRDARTGIAVCRYIDGSRHVVPVENLEPC